MRSVAALATKCQKRLCRFAEEVLVHVDADFGWSLANSDTKAKLQRSVRTADGGVYSKTYVCELALERGELGGAKVPFQQGLAGAVSSKKDIGRGRPIRQRDVKRTPTSAADGGGDTRILPNCHVVNSGTSCVSCAASWRIACRERTSNIRSSLRRKSGGLLGAMVLLSRVGCGSLTVIEPLVLVARGIVTLSRFLS